MYLLGFVVIIVLIMIDIKNVSKEYFGYSSVIHDVSVKIDRSEKIAFFGRLGSGKTSLLRMIASLEKITSGNISIAGTPISEAKLRNLSISMVFEDLALNKHKEVRKLLEKSFVRNNMTKKEARVAVREIAIRYGIEGLLDNIPILLSPLHRVKVAITRAFMKDKGILLIDNPLINLDTVTRKEYYPTLLEYIENSNSTIVYATDELSELELWNGRIVYIECGYIKQIGTYMELVNNPECVVVAKATNPNLNILCASIENDLLQIANSTYTKPKEISANSGNILLGIESDCIIARKSGDIKGKVQYISRGVAFVSSDISDDLIRCQTDGCIEKGMEIYLKLNIKSAKYYDFLTEKKYMENLL